MEDGGVSGLVVNYGTHGGSCGCVEGGGTVWFEASEYGLQSGA